MSQGERAAEQTKGFFKEASHAAESLRQNINSFADDLIGSKSGTHSNSADTATSHINSHSTTDPSPAPATMGNSDTSAGSHAGTHNTGLTGGGTTTGAQTASGIHPDAERLGSGIASAVDHAAKKLGEKKA